MSAQPAWRSRRELDGGDDPPTLGDILRIQASIRPDAPVMTFDGEVVTYGQFALRARQVANALLASGLRPGDRIAYIGRNSPSWFDLLFGAAMAGMVLVPVNWRLASDEVAYILANSTARMVFADREFTPTARRAMQERADRLPIIELDVDFADWRDAAPNDDPAIPVETDAVVIQIYTSGTTGRPKGALLTHHSINTVRVSQPATQPWSRWISGDVCLASMPLFHIGGASMPLSALYHGAQMVIVREFQPQMLFDMIGQHRVTKLFLAPTAIGIALMHPRARAADFSSLTHIFYGSSPIDPAVLREAMAVFGCSFAQVYGLTETSGTILVLPPEDHDPDRPERLGSVGKALRGVEIAIVDGGGARLPAGAIGEIAIRSQANMLGYWRDPGGTADAFLPDNWMRTGDAGFLDSDGYLHLRDRVKDMIISGGENVYAAEVEAVYAQHPAIAEIAVIAVPDVRWGEAVKAMIVLRPGHSLSLGEATAWGRERLASYKLPKSIEALDELPRNAAGKVLRRALRAPYWPQEARPSC